MTTQWFIVEDKTRMHVLIKQDSVSHIIINPPRTETGEIDPDINKECEICIKLKNVVPEVKTNLGPTTQDNSEMDRLKNGTIYTSLPFPIMLKRLNLQIDNSNNATEDDED